MPRYVGPEGSKQSKVTFIGEAPGRQEDLSGRPFDGEAGRILDELLRAEKISRSECYITNVLKYRPPNNDISPWFSKTKSGVITSEEFKKAVADLHEELTYIDSNVFVPMGNVALYAMTGFSDITKRRGSIYERTIQSPLGTRSKVVKIIPTIHPAATIKRYDRQGYEGGNYLYRIYIAADLRKIKIESKSSEVNLPKRDLIVFPSYNSIMEFLTSVQSDHTLEPAIDIEVVNDEIYCISIAPSPLTSMSIPFIRDGRHYLSPDEELRVWREIGQLFSRQQVIGQNIVFDLSMIFRKYGIAPHKVDDTMIAMGILFPDLPKGLDFITSIYTNEPYYKDEGKKWFRIGGSEQDFGAYNAKDSAVVKEIMPKLLKELDRQLNRETYEYQKMLVEPCIYMQSRGFRMDTDGLDKAVVDTNERLKQLEEELNTLCGRTINPRSPDQVMDYFYREKGIKPYLKEGKPTSDINALIRLARRGFKEAEVLKQIRKYGKAQSSYYEVKLSDDGRLRAAMNPIGAETGRLSSTKDIYGRGLNIQTLPDYFKPYVLADYHNLMYIADIKQGENKIVAYISPEPLMISAFENDRDLHKQTAALVLGIHVDDVSDEPGSCQLGTGEQSQRFWGKKANHSLNYDLGYRTFSLKYELPEIEGKILVDRFHMVYPGIRRYHAWVKHMLATQNRTLVNFFNRRRRFLDEWDDKLWKEAYAQIPQSTIADKINRQGVIPIYYNPEYAITDLLNQVHDSIVFQIPLKHSLEQHAKVLIALKKSLETPLHSPPEWSKEVDLTLELDIKVGISLSKNRRLKFDGTSTDRLVNQLHEVCREFGAEGEL